MRDRPRPRLPWEKDPNDREANYRRPIEQTEKVRLVLKAVAVLGAFLFIKSATADRSDVGSEFLIGIGAPLIVAGVLDFVWTVRGRLEHTFIESRPLQLAAHAGMGLLGAGMMAAGLIARTT